MTEARSKKNGFAGIAIVTGGGRGLGRAMALGLLSAGYRVTINDIDDEAISDTITAAKSSYGEGRILGVRADLADSEAAADLVAQTREKFGGLDVLVNNAGVGPEIVRPDYLKNPIRIWEIPVDIWCRALAINTCGPFFTARAAIPNMVAQGWGRIINVTTSLDTMIRPGFAPYGGSKAATEAYTAILAGDLEGTGVTANVLIPGGAANTRLIPADTPIDRDELVQPSRMVAPLLWLASNASDGVTGRRYVARFWDDRAPIQQAVDEAGAPIAWPAVERVADRTQV